MTLWPSTLPQSLEIDGYSSGFADNRIETKMEYGPPKRRLRTTTNIRPLNGSMVMTQVQYAALLTFFHTTVREVEKFSFPDPHGGSALEVCFSSAPTHAPTRAPGRWRVSLSFDVFP